MRISELVSLLLSHSKEHGDIDVCIYSNDDYYVAEDAYYDDEFNCIVIDN